jgi:transposase
MKQLACQIFSIIAKKYILAFRSTIRPFPDNMTYYILTNQIKKKCSGYFYCGF